MSTINASQKRISLVIPCYNEEEVLGETIKRLKLLCETLNGLQVELIFIDDGSKDRTRELLKNFAKQDSSVRVILFARNFGHQIAVTAGIGIEKLVEQFEKDHDDYNSIMIKAIADRLAEAFAEKMHELVRKEFWGYAKDEELTTEDLIKEEYLGIRPAPGYPACPDHTEKRLLFDLLQAEKNAGIELTENFAMYPAASVSGFYFGHPESKYFGIGKINKDQVEDYAKRKGKDLAFIEKWLAPNLGYDN